jgi:hypothetical protein
MDALPSPNPQRIDAATQALSLASTFSLPADQVLHQFFRTRRELGPLDRAFAAEVMYAVLRRWRVLAQIDEVFMYGVAPEVLRLAPEWRILALIWQAPCAQLVQFMTRWYDAPKPLRGVGVLRQTRRQWQRLCTTTPSRIASYLRQFDRRLLQQVALIEPRLAMLLQRVDTAQATMTPMHVRGGDLIRLGITAGPLVGQLLQALNDALLDGATDLCTYDAQIDWVKAHRLWRANHDKSATFD